MAEQSYSDVFPKGLLGDGCILEQALREHLVAAFLWSSVVDKGVTGTTAQAANICSVAV